MDRGAEPFRLQTIFSQKTYKSSGCFKIKFPGVALAWLVITVSTLVRTIFLPPLLHNAVDITLYFLSFAIGLYGEAKNNIVVLGLLPILWSCLLTHWALIIMVLTNTDKPKHLSIALGVMIAGALGLYYFIAAISYRIITNDINSEVTMPTTTATTTTTPTPQPTTTAAAELPTRRRSRPSVPHLPSIIERSFTVVPSGDASFVPQEQRKPSDHGFVGGPMPIMSY